MKKRLLTNEIMKTSLKNSVDCAGSVGNLLDAVYRECRTILSPGAKVVVAVSGGGDSVALVMLLVGLQKKLKIKSLAVAHVNHNLRGKESRADELYVRTLADTHHLHYHLKKLNPQKRQHESIEAWARRERYAFFLAIKQKFSYDYIVTAHTADDQAETIYMRLERGCALYGLRGILPLRSDGVVRPLLALSGKELRAWLIGQNIAFCEDSSNGQTHFTRNRIRQYLLKQPQRFRAQLNSIARNAQAVWPRIEKDINCWKRQFVLSDTNGSFAVDKKGFSETIASEALAYLFRIHGIEFDERHHHSVFINIKRHSGLFLLPDCWCYYPTKTSVVFQKKPAVIDAEKRDKKVWQLPVPGKVFLAEKQLELQSKFIKTINRKNLVSNDKSTVIIDGNTIDQKSLIVRNAYKSDTFTPLGSKNEQNIMQYLKKQGISLFERSTIKVVTQRDNRIIWVVGVQIGEQFKITLESTRLIKFISKVLV